MNEELKRTPLFEQHQQLGGKIVPFAGWELPVQYSGVITEHNAVRRHAGLFDVSHMGEIWVRGREALEALQFLTCNNAAKLKDGKAQYNALLNERGAVVDDIIVYRFSDDRYLLCVNASNADKDFEWLVRHNRFDAEITNASAEWGQVALQGPKAQMILEKLWTGCSSLAPFEFAEVGLLGASCIVARTGYTGEDGFEIFVESNATVSLWNALLAGGEAEGLIPCGLGARDSLRLEACYPLHGHELSDDYSALESNLGWIVKFDKGDFIGKEALLDPAARRRALVGFFVDDPGIARAHDKVFVGDNPAGEVTSGTKTPSLNRALGMAMIDAAHSAVDTPLLIEVRGNKLKAHVVKKPFYKRGTAS